jgi:hypothetical protein
MKKQLLEKIYDGIISFCAGIVIVGIMHCITELLMNLK